MATLIDLLKMMIESGASDLHITTGSAPRLRKVGRLVPVESCQILMPEDTKDLCYSIMTESQKKKFEETNEIDLSFSVKGVSRFRANIYMQRGAVAGAFRAIPFSIKSMAELGLPESLGELLKKQHGLVLVTGPTGSGKSTTLASMIDNINQEKEAHIVTVEDPIEFLYSHKKALINQREVHSDTGSFVSALKYILRQDPDVVLIGEMRDMETIEAALTISETGHLTFATLHTNSAIQTINRIIDVFPPYKQGQIRVQLSFVLEGIISQRLIPRKDGQGRALALEALLPTPAIRNLIREDKLHQIYSMMQTGQSRSGMLTMNQSLFNLYSTGVISYEDSLNYSPMPEEMMQIHMKAGTINKPGLR
ncbi:MAG: type IV pilus twitching motility protein PilT [Nitrospirae bacterium]|nr:type IV pilus twitching motility protein PilT [Nitrospirota bacterium]